MRKRYFCRPQNIFPAKFCVSWEYFLASPIAHNSICENDVAKASNDETKSPAIDCPPERKNWIEFPRAPGISASLSHDERISKIPSGIELLLAYEQSHKVSILAVISFQISNTNWSRLGANREHGRDALTMQNRRGKKIPWFRGISLFSLKLTTRTFLKSSSLLLQFKLKILLFQTNHHENCKI